MKYVHLKYILNPKTIMNGVDFSSSEQPVLVTDCLNSINTLALIIWMWIIWMWIQFPEGVNSATSLSFSLYAQTQDVV